MTNRLRKACHLALGRCLDVDRVASQAVSLAVFLKEFAERTRRLIPPLRENGQVFDVLLPLLILDDVGKDGLPLFVGQRRKAVKNTSAVA